MTNNEYRAVAERFGDEFAPQVGTDYSIALGWAKEQFAGRLKDFDDIDAKAHAVIGYMGGTAGAITVGGVVAASAANVSAWVVLAVLPSAVLAAVATVFAILCRRTGKVPVPHGVSDLVENAESFWDHPPDESRRLQEAAMIGGWWRADAHLATEVGRKAWWLNRSFVLYAASVCGLLLPFALAVGIKLANGSSQRTPPPTIAHFQ